MADKAGVLAFLAALILAGCHESPTGGDNASATVAPVRVRTIRPKRGQGLEVAVEQPAFVAPYYRADLHAVASGIVSFIEKDIGDRVTAGERLVEVLGADKVPMVVKAPFDGVVAARGVDPGAFVQNAAVVPGARALMTIERTDIVTVSMAVPEPYLARIGKETEAEIRVDALPGAVIRGRITRLAPSLRESDRTLQVEVDLFNGTAEEYRRFVARANEDNRSSLKGRSMPSFSATEAGNQGQRLLPGMYGTMRLLLKSFQDMDLVPSQVVTRKGGVPGVLVVEGGLVRRVPVLVEFDNGLLARIRRATGPEDRREFTGQDEMIVANQSELTDGQAVQANPADW